MRKLYIDTEYKCHANPAEGFREITDDTEFFNGKCDAFIEGYRYVPAGECYVAPNGRFFRGKMICPWADYKLLAFAQAAYEEGQATGTGGIDELLAAAGDAYTEGVNTAYDS